MRVTLASAFALVALATCAAIEIASAQESDAKPKPVPEVARETIEVVPGARLPLYLSRDWSKPLPDIERAVILQHGRARNADVYFKTALTAQAAAGDTGRKALMIAPQFIDQLDVDTFHVADDILRFTPEGWEGGDAAIAPKPVSSFTALDAILAHLADRAIFPNLKTVVVAGHSGGGQVVQRYAIMGKGGAALEKAGITVSYVVANPSSYAYFSSDRPEQAIARTCPGYDTWKYGMQDLPAYAQPKSPAELERDYVSRRVIYLLGSLDTDPNHPVLDKSCMAEAQGPYRWARGHSYIAYMKARDADTPRHALHEIIGVGHNGDKMFTAACGLSALFDMAGCK
jgi:pimeloyl-ACP methyl ester carboxylesterase